MFGSVFALKNDWFNIFLMFSDDFDVLISKTNTKKIILMYFQIKTFWKANNSRKTLNQEWVNICKSYYQLQKYHLALAICLCIKFFCRFFLLFSKTSSWCIFTIHKCILFKITVSLIFVWLRFWIYNVTTTKENKDIPWSLDLILKIGKKKKLCILNYIQFHR